MSILWTGVRVAVRLCGSLYWMDSAGRRRRRRRIKG